MDTVRPWIIKQMLEGPMEHYKKTESDPEASVIPLEPFRGQRVQFIRFLSPHRWGTHQPIWAEASDRQVTILVYLSSVIVKKFEQEQAADRRTFCQLSYPIFSLGGCRWAVCNSTPWVTNHHHSNHELKFINRQVCIQVVTDLPNKNFRFGSTAAFPFPTWPAPKTNCCDKLVKFSHALRNEPIWILLNKRLQVTLDPRLCITETQSSLYKGNQQEQADPYSNPSVQIAIPHTGPSRRTRVMKARMVHKNSTVPNKPTRPFMIKSTSKKSTHKSNLNNQNPQHDDVLASNLAPHQLEDQATNQDHQTINSKNSIEAVSIHHQNLLVTSTSSLGYEEMVLEPKTLYPSQNCTALSSDERDIVLNNTESSETVDDHLSSVRGDTSNQPQKRTEDQRKDVETNDAHSETNLLTNASPSSSSSSSSIQVDHTHRHREKRFTIKFPLDLQTCSSSNLPLDVDISSTSLTSTDHLFVVNVHVKGQRLDKYFNKMWPLKTCPYSQFN